MVHDDNDGDVPVPVRGQRQCKVTPALTRARARQNVSVPRVFALLTSKDDTTRSLTEVTVPDVAPDLPWPAKPYLGRSADQGNGWNTAANAFEPAKDKQQRGTNIITAKWGYACNVDEFGHVVRAKASVVARAFVRCEGVDFFETISRYPSAVIIRLLAAITRELG